MTKKEIPVQIWLSSEDQRKALTFPDGCDWKRLHSDSKQQDALFKSLHTYTCMLLISTHLTSYPGNCQLRSSEMWRARVPAAESRSLSFCPQPWTDSAAFEASRNLCCDGSFHHHQPPSSPETPLRRPSAGGQELLIKTRGCAERGATLEAVWHILHSADVTSQLGFHRKPFREILMNL